MMATMTTESTPAVPSTDRLLAVIELQNAIAASSMAADDVMRIAAERAGTMMNAPGAVVALVEGDDLVYRAVHGTAKATLGTRLSLATAQVARCIAERKARLEDGSASVPLMYGEHAVGLIQVLGGTFGAEDTETLKLLATIISISLHRAHSYPRPRMDSTHDALTGLENRRAFDERISAELTRNKRYGQTFSLAVVDLDGFSTANDRFGQATGDQILRDIANVLKAHTRVIDACFRLGGDEFAIVMPGTALEGARILAERCRVHIVEAKLAELADSGITASFGVVEAIDESAAELIVRSNNALQADKAAHR